MDRKVSSKSDLRIIEATSLGYTATKDGKVFSPLGNEIKGSAKRDGHFSITLSLVEGKTKTVLKHRFIYYYFYGDKLFTKPLVRHLNDDPSDNRIENLEIGTPLDNRLDIPREKIISSIPQQQIDDLIERSRKLTDDDIIKIRNERESTGLSYAKIAEKYGIRAMTVYRACTRNSWKDIGG